MDFLHNFLLYSPTAIAARDTPSMQHVFQDAEERALRLDGLSGAHGSLAWPHPAPPLLRERATLVASIIPSWAIAAAQTAGWVYTGLGRAEPWALCAPRSPAISPLQRREWKPRSPTPEAHELQTLSGLTLTTPSRTLSDLLVWPGDDEIAACQLFEMADHVTLQRATERALYAARTATMAQRVRVRSALTRKWWEDYPLVTR